MRTTFDTERSEPLIEYDLPDDWYRCKGCNRDTDPEDVKDRFLTDSELCSSDCAREYMATLESDLENEKRVNVQRKTALRGIMTATDARTVAGIPLTWFSVMGLTDKVRELAINGLYLNKDEVTECQTKH